ncbi:hypothetical protein [Paraflavitalea pollutisoli]|uniref:hypothetical protein n=1 Tax=Paraflavitalea pollutisoli TaxID=3034143 RepID=UPI0023EDA1C7|nr:hypothetical protein [Paraflavitalea sp. H1-2-19X]
MKNTSGQQALAQAFLRLAMGIGFLSPTLDRLGGRGPYGISRHIEDNQPAKQGRNADCIQLK